MEWTPEQEARVCELVLEIDAARSDPTLTEADRKARVDEIDAEIRSVKGGGKRLISGTMHLGGPPPAADATGGVEDVEAWADKNS